jgi:uncharacterized protein YfdQ (DUF2303 family)
MEKTPTAGVDAGNGGGLPNATAIRELATLGIKGSDADVVGLATDGLGEGLPKEVPAIWDRNGQRLYSVRPLIEEYRLRPARRTGKAMAQTLHSFIALVNRHKDADSAIFADMDWKAPGFTAVIDYHRGEEAEHEPRHLGHRITYSFPLSEEWKTWLARDGKAMSQLDFAAFIEERIADLSAPKDTEADEIEHLFRTRVADPGEVVQLSRGLAVSVDSRVARAVTLQSGEGEMVFEEVHRDGSGQKLTIPGVFMISVPVFFRGAQARLPVRLRYRVKDEMVTWFYQLWRPDTYVTDAILRDRDAVAVETGLPIYEGAPEA